MNDYYYDEPDFLNDIWEDYESEDEDFENEANIIAEDVAMEGSLFGWDT